MFVIPDRGEWLTANSRKHPLKVRVSTDMLIVASSVGNNSLERSQQWLKKKNLISITTTLFNKSTQEDHYAQAGRAWRQKAHRKLQRIG
jgi:hypothetical protein